MLGSLGYGYFYLNPQTSIASSLGANPEIPNVQGGMQALQWTRNPLPSRTDLSKPIPLPHTQASVTRQLPLPELQLGGYLTSTRLLGEHTDALGEGLNRGLYGSITWPLELPVGLDSRLWAAGTDQLRPREQSFPDLRWRRLAHPGRCSEPPTGRGGPRPPAHQFQLNTQSRQKL